MHRTSPQSVIVADATSIASGPQLSRHTRAVLRQLRLTWRAERCESVLQAVGDAPLPIAAQLFTLGELELAAAQDQQCSLSRDDLLLEAAAFMYVLLLDDPDDHAPPQHLAMAVYNRAVSLLLTGPPSGDLLHRAEALGITIDPDSIALAGRLDRVIDADSLEFSGLLERHRQSGLGAALVGTITEAPRTWRHARAMDGGYAKAITALLHFDWQGPELQLADTSVGGIVIGERTFPLHADFTAPYAWQLGHSRLRSRETLGAFFPARVAREGGLLLLEPFEPRKIPVLMIHGFWSSPEAWRNITNEILATPELRERFQIWHYFYPTGVHYLYSAGALRANLTAFHAELRAAYGADALQPLVVIGHSEGGLLARALIVDSGSTLWDTVFRVPADSLTAPSPVREALRRTLMLAPLPDIDTVILMATPNSGIRSIRNSLRAGLINLLTDLPDAQARALRTLQREHPDQLHNVSRRWFARGGTTALESMAPDNVLMSAFARLPFTPSVHVHSIVAVHPDTNAFADGDEFVPRASAHVPGAESELVTRAAHQDIDGPEIFAEIRRILRRRAFRDSTPAESYRELVKR